MPVDLRATLNSGQVFHWDEYLSGVFVGAIGDEVAAVRQPDAGGPIEVLAGDPERVRDFFGLDDDMAAIHATFPADDVWLRRAIEFAPGLRIARQPHWECLATFITSSLKQVAHIRAISLTLRRRFGEPREVTLPDGGSAVAFTYPSPQAMAAAGEAALRECKLGYRAAGMHRAACAIADGSFDLDAISRLGDDDARAALRMLHGVGEKIADCVLLFGFGRTGVFPIDVWVERVLRELYFPRRRMSVPGARIRRFARDHFGRNRGYAQQYLFHFARLASRRGAPLADALISSDSARVAET